jgi:hypothetical protein
MNNKASKKIAGGVCMQLENLGFIGYGEVGKIFSAGL